MPHRTSIRIATTADIPDIVAIVNSAFEVETFLDGTRTDGNNVAGMMQKGEFLLMEDASGHLLASVFVELHGDRGYSGMFAVESSRQSMGLGRAMVEVVEDHCRNHGCKFLDIKVLSPRTKLPPFYRSLGYVETGVEEFRISRPLKDGIECHFILMSKTL